MPTEDDGYDAACKLWNFCFYKLPFVITHAVTVKDVVLLVAFPVICAWKPLFAVLDFMISLGVAPWTMKSRST